MKGFDRLPPSIFESVVICIVSICNIRGWGFLNKENKIMGEKKEVNFLKNTIQVDEFWKAFKDFPAIWPEKEVDIENSMSEYFKS